MFSIKRHILLFLFSIFVTISSANRGRFLISQPKYSANPKSSIQTSSSPKEPEIPQEALQKLAAYQQLLAELHAMNEHWDHAPEGGFRGGNHHKATLLMKDKKEDKCDSIVCRFMLFMRHMKHTANANSDHKH